MNRFSFLGFFFFSFFWLNAQSVKSQELDPILWSNLNPITAEESDFVVLGSNQKVFGKINRNYNQANYDQISFEENGLEKVLEPKDIVGFGLKNGQIFLSKVLPGETSPVFLQRLISGPIDFSGYKGRYFLEKGEEFVELQAFYKQVEIPLGETRKFLKPFVSTLKLILEGGCGVELYPKIERIPFTEEAITSILVSYFECTNSSFQSHVVRAPFLILSPTLSLGPSYYSLTSVSRTVERADQFENNIGFQGFIGVRLHELRKLPRFSMDIRFGFSNFSTQLFSSYEGTQAIWTGSEKVKETAIYLPVSFNYSILKNSKREIYLGLTGGLWNQKTELSEGILDERLLTYEEVYLTETSIVRNTGVKFIPGIKAGFNLGLGQMRRLFFEIEGNVQKEYYRFFLFQNEADYTRNRLSLQLGIEF
ncbi:hypothetical protein DFQ04_2520 [Algoriphagus boseongensis]|uniref:Outer membrane protein with beta-barrel domain n=1 Tax=Algoriphagus boseongensis TaxID=1442587 RepID=A0A4R6T3T8_9BACT|nr:hypothetical protein [Algoriphagus boseongensis]TDQ16402.1 hypothetical protein DFQ04_2520 [Algoriphagus boseongensis]